MAENRTLFFLSGFFSISLFTLFLALFVNMMLSSNLPKTFALKKDDFISVSIEMPTAKIKKTKAVASTPQVVESLPISEEAEIDIDDLFSDVWTKKIKKVKPKAKEVNKRVLDEIQKKSKIKTDTQTQSIVEKINDMDSSKQDNNTTQSSSTANEVNEYLAKIHGIIYKYFYPPENSQGHTVKAVIVLSAIGKVMDFRILTYSANGELNQECDKIKARLKGVMFPSNPDNRSFTRAINIISDKD